MFNLRKCAFGTGNGEYYTEHYLGLKGTKCYSLMNQAIFWIYSTIGWVVFLIQKIKLKSVILLCELL